MCVSVAERLLADRPGWRDPLAVVAWLLAGDAVPDPLHDMHDGTDVLARVELYLEIAEAVRLEGIDFAGLPRRVRNGLLNRIYHLQKQEPGDEQRQS